MANAQENLSAEATTKAPSWLSILVGYWVAGALLAIAAVLLLQFLQKRPDDLVAYTGHLVDNVLQDTLRANNVPEDRIFHTTSRMQRDDRARWMDFTLDVYLPKRISADGLQALVRETLLDHDVKLDVLSSAPEGQSWRLKLGRLPFATVRVRDRSLAAQVVTDLTATCNRITNDVEDVLFEAGVAEQTFTRETPVVQVDDETRWTRTQLGLVLPEGLTPGELRARIEAALSHRDVRVSAEDMGMGAVSLVVAYGGKVCTDILCRPGLATMADPTTTDEVPPPVVTTEPPAPNEAAIPEAPALEVIDEIPPEAADEDLPETEAPTPPGPREKRGNIAIILDDGGNDWAVAEKVLALDTDLTLALLPNTPFIAQIAEAAAERGFEVILHMPMETDSKKVNPGPGKITTAMDKAEIQRLTREALAQIPGVKGANNHTGSTMTADRASIGYFLEVLLEEGLFFVDSRTTNTTVAYDVAQEMGVPVAARDVFLDDANDTASSKARLDELVELALARGSAIGIGHFREETAALLAQEIPKLTAKGVSLVHVSELLP